MNFDDLVKQGAQVSKDLREKEKVLRKLRWTVRPMKDPSMGFTSDLDRNLYIDSQTAEAQQEVDLLRDELQRIQECMSWMVKVGVS